MFLDKRGSVTVNEDDSKVIQKGPQSLYSKSLPLHRELVPRHEHLQVVFPEDSGDTGCTEGQSHRVVAAGTGAGAAQAQANGGTAAQRICFDEGRPEGRDGQADPRILELVEVVRCHGELVARSDQPIRRHPSIPERKHILGRDFRPPAGQHKLQTAKRGFKGHRTQLLRQEFAPSQYTFFRTESEQALASEGQGGPGWNLEAGHREVLQESDPC